MDGDCPSQHACIDQRCQNPCIVRNPCSGAQKCVVTDSLPIRTVGCVCPDGSVAGPQGECVRGKCEFMAIVCSYFEITNIKARLDFITRTFTYFSYRNPRMF